MNDSKAAPPNVIVRLDSYENSEGNTILERVVVSGEPPPDFPRFIGTAAVTITTPNGPVQQPFNFVIPADTIERAFALFASTAQAEGHEHIERIKSAITRNALTRPPSPQEARLLDASGRPIG